jgi:hypothetical protein
LIEINSAMRADQWLLVNRQNSTVLSFYVMSYGRHWSAPLMLTALAGIIHERQRTDDQQHNGSEDNQ